MNNYYFLSNKGNIRTKNEDYILFFSKQNFTIGLLCDGLGGHKDGDFASKTIIDLLQKYFLEFINENKLKNIREDIYNIINLVKNELKKSVKEFNKSESMGSTLVAFLHDKNNKKIYVFYSGDSRCYIYTNKNELLQITKDHNLVNKFTNDKTTFLKNLNKEQQRYLTSAIGPKINTVLDFIIIENEKYFNINKIILTSDGIHEFLTKEELQAIIYNKKTPKLICESAINEALINDSNDNMSIGVYEVYNE
ncbi:PP2C family protein-serine/threonine phosphatase [Mycoplasma leonicaptivi]|uniref:PP2C family protein-serine/threonine phosphatase n=1 Tax=Mycoplasma leonicaptivi TaxID=36742 RepID=UPI0005672DA5|nr:protein phosphatase 2C domain-containing protein [Mycoplasma leonicaptivi]